MKIILFITLILSLFINIITCHEGHSTDTVKQIVLDEDTNFVVSWTISNNTADGTITFEIEGQFKGWFGFGFSCQLCAPDSMEAMMGHPDLFAITFDSNGLPILYDMIESMDYDPMQQKDIDIGGQDNILRYGGYQLSDRSLISFTRKLNTGDTIGDYAIDITKDFTVSWYIGKDNVIDFDNPSELGTTSFNLQSGEAVEGATGGHSHGDGEEFGALFAWHASLMGIAFGVLIPFGIFSARYLKSIPYGFYLHVAIQSIALSFIIVGFILVIVAHDGEVEISPHGILGMILFLLTCLVACGGLLSAFWKSSSSSSDKPPMFPHKVHGFFGKIIALLSIATIITGLNQYLVEVAFIIVYSILVLSYILITIFIEIFKRKNSTPGGDVGLQKFN